MVQGALSSNRGPVLGSNDAPGYSQNLEAQIDAYLSDDSDEDVGKTGMGLDISQNDEEAAPQINSNELIDLGGSEASSGAT